MGWITAPPSVDDLGAHRRLSRARRVERTQTPVRGLQAPRRRIVFAADPAHDHDNHRGVAMTMCPICKAEAEEIEPGTFDGVWFRCLKHREFGVSDTALKTRKDAEPEQWERALKKATERAGEGNRPKILDLDF
jgi:hypothetical protein